MIRSTAVSCLLSSLALAAGAQGEAAKPTNAAPAAVRDYGAGFRQFQALGLPDLAGAEYCTINTMGLASSYNRLQQMGLRGNGWVLAGATGPTVRVLFSDGAQWTVWRQADLTKQQMAEARKRKGGDGEMEMDRRTGATWKAADLGTDLERLLRRLQGRAAKEGAAAGAADADALVPDASSSSRDWELESSASPMFLFATMAYLGGRTNEANQVCGRLFDRFGNRKVIAGGIDALATAQLEQAKNAFQADSDWKAYAAKLEEIAARFAKVWPKAPAARLLASRVRARADGAPAPAAPGLPESDQALVRALATEGVQVRPDLSAGGRMYVGSDAWILQTLNAPTNATAAERLLARGLEAVPVLTAVLADPTPLPPERNVFSSSSYSFSSDDEADYSDEKMVEEAAANLPGPQTLGAWARSLLAPVVKGEGQQDYELMRMEAAELQQVARAWYEANKGRTPLELARAALASDDNARRDAAVALLAKSSNTTDLVLIEHALAEADADHAYQTMSTLQTLARLRGGAVSGVVERVLTNVEARLKSMGDGDARQQAGMLAWITNEVAETRALIAGSAMSFDEALRAFLAAGEQGGDNPMGSAALQRSLADTSPRDALGTILRLALATNGTARARAAGMLQWAQYMAQRPDLAQAGGSTNAATATDFAAEWRALLEDATAAPDTFTGYYTNVASLAAMAYAGLFDKEFAGRQRGLGPAFDEAFIGVLRARARAMVDGKVGADLPELPAADQVAEARRSAIRTELLAAPAERRHGLITSLTAAERLWLFEEVAADEALQKLLLPEASIIRRIDTSKAPSLAGRFDAVALNQPIRRAVLEACLTAVSNRQAQSVMVQRGDLMRGATLVALNGKGTPYDDWVTGMASDGPRMTGVVAITYVGSDIVRAFWPIGAPVEVAAPVPVKAEEAAGEEADALEDDVGDNPLAGAPLRADPAMQADFWKRAEAMMEAKDEGERPEEAFEGMRFFLFTLHDPSAGEHEASGRSFMRID